MAGKCFHVLVCGSVGNYSRCLKQARKGELHKIRSKSSCFAYFMLPESWLLKAWPETNHTNSNNILSKLIILYKNHITEKFISHYAFENKEFILKEFWIFNNIMSQNTRSAPFDTIILPFMHGYTHIYALGT